MKQDGIQVWRINIEDVNCKVHDYLDLVRELLKPDVGHYIAPCMVRDPASVE